jgi:Zn-dependent protease
VKPTFSLFGIPVRVVSTFWIMTALLGMQGGRGNLGKVFLWGAIVFTSIVLHELGHALTARRFGLVPAITLHGMGGLTQFEGGRLNRLQTCLVSFAGPAMGLIVGLPVWAIQHAYHLSPSASDLASWVIWVNVGWSLINLIPVVPYDGGHILAAALGPRRAFFTAVISAVAGAGAIAAAIRYFAHDDLAAIWSAVIFGPATFSSVRQARQLWQHRREANDGVGTEMETIRAAMSRGDSREVLATAEGVIERARTPITRNAGLLALAWANAMEGRAMAAREIVEKLERDAPPDPYLFAALEDALGAPERARAWLEAGRQKGWRRADTTKLLIDLYARDGQIDRAVDVAGEDLDLLGRDDARTVMAAAMGEGAYRAAARLADRIFEESKDPADGLDEARAWALAGDAARALALLELLVRDDGGLESPAALRRDEIRRDAAFQSLRGEARFERLLERPVEQTQG